MFEKGHEKHIGLIFSKQQTNFKESLAPQKRVPKQKPAAKTSLRIPGHEDFDPSIKYGRDNKLFLKRDVINVLVLAVRYTEQEL